MLMKTIRLLLLILPVLSTDLPACQVKLQAGDHKSDIYVNVLKWKEPTTTSSDKGVELECKTGFLQSELSHPKETFSCNKGLYNGSYQFTDLLCRSDYHQLVHIVEITPNELRSNVLHCDGPNLATYEVRRKIAASEKPLYRICFDTNTMRTKFSYKLASSEIPTHQTHSRQDVWGFDGYGKNSEERMKLSQGYVKKIQKQRITKAFPNKYNSRKEYPYYFNRGHLVAYADFNDPEDQKTTVEYLNAAPQWEVLNEHSWSLVERESRSLLQTEPQTWEVYTGTLGSIPTPRGPLFLVPVFDKNGKFLKGHLPVPLVFWKLVYNLKDVNKSRVFVGINNPEIRTSADIGPAYRLCSHPIKKDNKIISGSEYLGFTYECTLDEFLAKLQSDEKIVKPKVT